MPVELDVTASGVRLRVSQAGSGPAVLLLHGLFADRTTWGPVMGALGEGFRLIAPDFPGFGESEKPPVNRFPYGIHAFSEAICDLYAALDLSRATVVGHALGGAVALTLAARHPELVARLVLIDALCYPPRRDWARSIALVPFAGSLVFKQLLGQSGFRALYRDTMVSVPGALDPERVDAYYESFNTPAARGSALATLRATRDTSSLVADTARVQAPTLVVWGRSDRVFPPSVGQRVARQIRGATLRLMDTGHAPQEERPEELAAVVGRFLESPTTRA
jgi:pimeloyl-ACP methyl ester carboxylesterase